ncbi:MAG: hypothetical protein FJ297_16520 [Planctomycetes bacterium]|nr:hypothetical protein [Planctomycetota bacterium]
MRSEHPRLLFTRDIEQSVRAAAEDDPVPLGLVRQSRSWTRRDNSWNEVCDSGMLLGALAIVEHEPELASQVIDAARDSLPHGLSAYQPDGAYPEGRSYWEYGAMYTCLAIQGLTTAH